MSQEQGNHQKTIRVKPDMRQLIGIFLENKQKDIQNVKDCLLKNDYETIHTIGHRMKGAGTGYGAPEITRLGAELDHAARLKSNEKIRQIIEELSHYLEEVEVVFE